MSASSKLRRTCKVINAAYSSIWQPERIGSCGVLCGISACIGRLILYIHMIPAYISLHFCPSGQPFAATQPQSSASQANRRLEPPSRACSRALVSERGLLRFAGSRAGQVRDAAPSAHRGDGEDRGRRTFRCIAPDALPSAGRLRPCRLKRAASQASWAQGGAQAHARGNAVYRWATHRRRSPQRSSARSADRDQTRHVDPPPQYRTRPGAEKKTVITADCLPPAAISIYETLRREVLRGQARPDGLGAVVYHGMLDGLALLLPVTVTPTVCQPPTAQAPNVRGDHAFVRLLANMVLQTQSEVKHVY